MTPHPYAIHSWSGGKDGALALKAALQAGVPVRTLITAMDPNGKSSRSHAIPPALIKAQAAALGLQSEFYYTDWTNYEERFIATLTKHQRAGAKYAVFGDIDLQPHRDWEEKVCAAAGLEPILPLWHAPRLEIARAFIDQGFKAVVCCVNGDYLDATFAGREYNDDFLRDLPPNVCPCGEGGEFHTFVYDGPIFQQAVKFQRVAIAPYKTPPFLGRHTVYFYQLLDVPGLIDVAALQQRLNPHPQGA